MLPKSKYSPNNFRKYQTTPKKRKTSSDSNLANEIVDLTLDENHIISIDDDEEEQIHHSERVKCILIDHHHNEFNDEEEFELMSLLIGKLRGKFIRSVSLEFDSCYQLSVKAMKKPFDVKISYNHKLVVVSDYNANSLFLFDLITKRYLTKLYIKNPHYIAIESNVDYREGTENDAIIVTSASNHVYKIDIKLSVKNGKSSEIWKVGGTKHFNSPCGVVVYHNKAMDRRESHENSYFRLNQQERDENLVMVCDFNNNRIQVLGSKYGNLISSITLIPGIGLQTPWMIDVNSYGDLVLSEFSNRVQLIRYVSNVYDYMDIAEREEMDSDGWVSLHQFSSESNSRNVKTKCCGIVVDKTTQNVIICDRDSNIIRIFNVNGIFIKEVRGVINNPRGICIDERSGELLIVDSERKCVKRQLMEQQVGTITIQQQPTEQVLATILDLMVQQLSHTEAITTLSRVEPFHRQVMVVIKSSQHQQEKVMM
ncbi:predicted protein [Naegleria gruberi]|uniref:Predicted protein n=1 Tax=Naegleria gruberi TaxID=5762 RepID=D2W0N8_NAEGR|nr:uncharacterized protein NAEGRDRAFT_53769 [Naegleria gruberi]EFC37322.1 predicted protein [Naegleria gruberi]|eukprot:XP_002670066.1 predicted protein [Naegleria gruberi strain NEG-M]